MNTTNVYYLDRKLKREPPDEGCLVLKGGPHWTCKGLVEGRLCGSDTFHLNTDGLYCAECGEFQEMSR